MSDAFFARRLVAERTSPSARPCIEAQYMELALRYERLRTNVPIAPGMFVREKQGCGVFKTHIPIAWIVLRHMEPGSPIDKAMIDDLIRARTASMTGWRYHWLCASLTDDGAALDLWVFDADQLEPVPQDDLPAGVHDVAIVPAPVA